MTPDQIADLVGRDGYELRGPIGRAENCRIVPEYPRQPAPNLAHQHGVIARRSSADRAKAWRRAHGLGMGTQASGGRQRVQQIYASGQTAPDNWA